MKPRVCVGRYATEPYYFDSLKARVYCLEELVYCLKENAFLLDTEIMSDTLLDWIAGGCGAVELARELHPLVHQKGSLSAFVLMIMEYVGFYGEEVLRQVEQTLKKGVGLSLFEKRRTKIDYLVETGKYAEAVQGYEELLVQWEEEQQAARGSQMTTGKHENENNAGNAAGEWKAAVLHNKGVALSGLMQYKDAAEAFRQAHLLDANPGSLRCYLAARRLELSEGDYITFAAGLSENLEESLALEKQMEQLQREWQESEKYQYLQDRRELRSHDTVRYYEENEKLIAALQEEYRHSI